MIKGFKDKRPEQIYNGDHVKRLDNELLSRARRRLQLINAATRIEDLYFPPSNRFHAIEGSHSTRYSIRVNDQWRITFEWLEGNADSVLFEDYH